MKQDRASSRWMSRAVAIAAAALALAACDSAPKSGPSPTAQPAIAQAQPAPDETAPAAPLPSLEDELRAKRERESRRARSSGLPSLQEELAAKRAREGRAEPEPTPPAAQPAPAAEPPPAPPAEPPPSAGSFRPAWWVEGVVERDGVATACGEGDARTLVEARRIALDRARAALREALGPGREIPEAPVQSTAARLPDGSYRAFVLFEVRRR